MLRLTILTQFLIDYFAECITNNTITYPLLIFYFLKISSLLSNLPLPMCWILSSVILYFLCVRWLLPVSDGSGIPASCSSYGCSCPYWVGSNGHQPGADLQRTHCVALTRSHGFAVDIKALNAMGSWLAVDTVAGAKSPWCKAFFPSERWEPGIKCVALFVSAWIGLRQVLWHLWRQLCQVENLLVHSCGQLSRTSFYGLSFFPLLHCSFMTVLSNKVVPLMPWLQALLF